MIMSIFEKMRLFYSVILLISVAFIFTSCKDNEVTPVCTLEPIPSVKLTVQPMFGTQELVLDDTYSTVEGYKVQFTDIKFYMQDIKNGATQMIDAALFDYRLRGDLLLETNGDASNYTSLQANLGVDSSINHDNPTDFDNASMLNISNSNDMHWGWNPGFIFVKIEARVDTIPDATDIFNHNIVFHIGRDENLQLLNFTNLQWLTTGVDQSELQFELDMATFLQGSTQSIDLKTEFTSHTLPGQEALSLKVMENFKEALKPL